MKIDFVIASSENFTGFHSTNIKNAIHGYAPREPQEVVEYIKENWPGSTMTSDSMFDIPMEDRRAYTEKDRIYTNKLKNRLSTLEGNRVKQQIIIKSNLTNQR